MRFESNRGQWHSAISWVAEVPKDMFGQYHGAGWCRVEVGPGKEVLRLDYVDPDGKLDGLKQSDVEWATGLPTRDPLTVLAMASGHQLCIEAGTASGAIISALTVKSS